MLKSVFAMVLACSIFSGSVLAEGYTAKVMPIGGEKILFNLKRAETREGVLLRVEAVFATPDGQVAVSEKAESENARIRTYAVDKLQTQESGGLEVRDGKVRFSYTRKGKTETAEEKATENLVVGPTLVEYLQRHWDKLIQGEDIEIRFAALDRRETVGFKLFKTGEETVAGKSRIIVKMKPTSFIIAALVNPIHFAFESDSRRLVDMKGRTTPKVQLNGEWKDLDAHIVYEY